MTTNRKSAVWHFWPAVLAGLVLCVWASAAGAAESREDRPDARTVAPSRFGERPADEAFGAFQRGLYMTARNLALPRAEAGDAAAQTLLAEIYSRGLGVPRDLEQAADWYMKAAGQGVPEAQLQYALILLKGDPDEETKAEALELMKSAADAGNGHAEFNYAQLLVNGRPGSQNLKDAYRYFQRAAEKGIADAQYAVSQYLANGTGGIVKDSAQAREWLFKAARQNFDTAQYELGQWYLHGIGGERELDKAYAWTLRAARAGNIAAQAAVAKLYWGGLGTQPDEGEAAAWYVAARRAGLRDRALDDFWEGLTEEEQRSAIDRANQLR
jgi:TPR repeat protein